MNELDRINITPAGDAALGGRHTITLTTEERDYIHWILNKVSRQSADSRFSLAASLIKKFS